MDYQSEKQLELLLIKDLEDSKYERVTIWGVEDLKKNLRDILFRLNKEKLKDIPFSDTEFGEILRFLEGRNVFESAKTLRDQYVLRRDSGEEVYIDFLTPDFNRNVYQVTNQITVEGKYTNRYDVTLLINGFPVVQIELKRRGMDLKTAFDQTVRYKRHSLNGLFKFVQLFVISNGVNTKYYANSGEVTFEQTFYWTDSENVRMSSLKEFTESFLNRVFLTKVLTKYMVLRETDKDVLVMRPYQIYATEAVVNRALNTHLSGYVWHTTGSGKTLTSFKAAQLIAKDARVKKVFFLVDRKDLDHQTTQEFNRFEANSVDTTDSTGVLVKQIEDPKKNMIVTTIQKMATAVNRPKYAKVLQELENEKVIFIIDECHRSQFGKMYKDISRFFKKAQYFGFTGTPIFEGNGGPDGRTTADIFEKCLHTYLIKNAIHDRNVLGFNVEYIQTFKGQYNNDNGEEVEDIDKREAFLADDRLNLVANHIVQYHNHKVKDKKHTALFTVDSIPLLVKYYDIFKKIKHDLKIAGIFTYGQNEDAEGRDEYSRESLERMIGDYNKLYGTSYSTHTFQAYNVDISKNVKSGNLDILLVVNMYTTGFDSKPLSTLYVDRHLKFHTLLQAFSRTNRIKDISKPHGNIICYRNMKKYTDEAIRMFSMTDSVDDVLLREYSYYRDQFRKSLEELYKIVDEPKKVDNLESETDQKKFILAFRELSKLLLVMQTFSTFEFSEDELNISEQTFQDFKSKYSDLYEEVKRTRETKNKASILDDIDFEIELMHTDRINVDYIMRLIRNIDMEDKQRRKRDIAHILKELNRTDNKKLKKKADLIRAFLHEVIPELGPQDSLDEELHKYEDAARNKEIEEFAKENDVDEEVIARELNEVAYANFFNKERVRSGLKGRMGLLEKNRLIEKIRMFIEELVEKYE